LRNGEGLKTQARHGGRRARASWPRAGRAVDAFL
jgi:hypothetical protein